MNTQLLKRYRQNGWRAMLEPRLIAAVSKRLNVDANAITLIRWQPNRDGSETPVFNVPSSHQKQAIAEGLTVA